MVNADGLPGVVWGICSLLTTFNIELVSAGFTNLALPSSVCGTSTDADTDYGEISFPFNQSAYPAQCSWVVNVDFSISVVYDVYVRLYTFNISTDDYLRISDSANSETVQSTHVLSSVVGPFNPPLQIEFFSSSEPGEGFRIRWELGLPPGQSVPYSGYLISETKLTESSQGYITTPNYPSDYPQDSNINWILVGPPGRKIQIELLVLDTEPETDELKIYSGWSIYSKQLRGSYSGILRPEVPILIDETVVLLNFQSDSYIRFDGFLLRYSIYTAPTKAPELETVDSGLSNEAKNGIIIAVVVVSLICIAAGVAAFYFTYIKPRQRRREEDLLRNYELSNPETNYRATSETTNNTLANRMRPSTTRSIERPLSAHHKRRLPPSQPVNSDGTRALTHRPVSARPMSAMPTATRPTTARPGTARPGTARPGTAARPGTTAARPASGRPGSGLSRAVPAPESDESYRYDKSGRKRPLSALVGIHREEVVKTPAQVLVNDGALDESDEDDIWDILGETEVAATSSSSSKKIGKDNKAVVDDWDLHIPTIPDSPKSMVKAKSSPGF